MQAAFHNTNNNANNDVNNNNNANNNNNNNVFIACHVTQQKLICGRLELI